MFQFLALFSSCFETFTLLQSKLFRTIEFIFTVEREISNFIDLNIIVNIKLFVAPKLLNNVKYRKLK